MTERGYLVRNGDRMRVSGIAEERLKQFSALQLNNERTECLYAACSSTSAFSLGMIGRALSQEPDFEAGAHYAYDTSALGALSSVTALPVL